MASLQAKKQQLNYPIGGVNVKFPYSPYAPQIAMMAKIIKALNNSENALLESPTGSGKSLALLCSALAWQKGEIGNIEKQEVENRRKILKCSCECHEPAEPPTSLPGSMPISSGSILPGSMLPGSIPTSSGSILPSSAVPGSTKPLLAPTQLTGSSKASILVQQPSSTMPQASVPVSESVQVPLAPPPATLAMTLATPQAPLNPTPEVMVVSKAVAGTADTPIMVPDNSQPVSSHTATSAATMAATNLAPSTSTTSILCPAQGTVTPGSMPAVSKPILPAMLLPQSSKLPGTDVKLNSLLPRPALSTATVTLPSGGGTAPTGEGTVPSGEGTVPDPATTTAAGGEASEVEKKDAVAKKKGGRKKTDDDDDDFKPPKKKFRNPLPAAVHPKRSKRARKGVVYEDDTLEGEEEAPATITPHDDGTPATWTMESNTPSGALPSIGLPLSQVMDTGPINDQATSSSTSTLAGVAPPSSTNWHSSRSPGGIPSPSRGKPSPSGCLKCDCARLKASPDTDRAKRAKYPKIYYATRTHKQIAQITRELRKSAYSKTPMCILSSREHTCIHPEVSKSKNKNDDCKLLLDYDKGVSCPFFHRVGSKLGSQAQLQELGMTEAWDIEELVRTGKRVKACPYFAARGIAEEADIIFCPYNYLVDPLIRDQMQIEVGSKVIIFDEAHNIEDCARDAASLTISSEELAEVSKEIEDIVPQCPVNGPIYENLNALIRAILRWIDLKSETLPQRGYEQAYGVWLGEDFLTIMDRSFGVNQSTLQIYQTSLHKATEAALDKNNDQFDEQNQRHRPEPTLTMLSLNRIKSILVVMEFIFKNNKQFIMDYRMSLIKTTAFRPKPGVWHKRGRRNRDMEKVWIYELNFWCLNPAVAFLDLTLCRSIILTSGTLSPLMSFASELGVAFPIQLETKHVISESQTWVRSISQGPNGIKLSATYQNSETFEFKDELGKLVLRVCETVPYGVLCFMSSYNMLEKLSTRWQETGVWNMISCRKEIVSEPRTGGKEVFDEAMATFYQEIAEAEALSAEDLCSGACRTGALFLAVCRGKVSEGLDFSDNNARAVITIGIPFPNFKNKQIELKREYNDEHCRRRGVLTGSEWYEIQAYRALNQALGRCIRHKKDWGALILVDSRYAKGTRYTKGLSKWVRHRVCHEEDFSASMISLRWFVDRMMNSDPNAPPGSDTSTVNDTSKSSISFLEKSPSSSRVSLATSMTSPPPVSTPHPPISTGTQLGMQHPITSGAQPTISIAQLISTGTQAISGTHLMSAGAQPISNTHLSTAQSISSTHLINVGAQPISNSTAQSIGSTHPINVGAQPISSTHPINLGAQPISSTHSIRPNLFLLTDSSASIPESFQISPVRVEFWDDAVTSTPASTKDASTSGKQERGAATPARKYPELLPISEIHKMEARERQPHLPDTGVSEKVCNPSPNKSATTNGFIQSSTHLADSTLLGGSVTRSAVSVYEGESTILYGSGIQPSRSSPPPSLSTTEHAHVVTVAPHNKSSPLSSNNELAPIPPDAPSFAVKTEISESPIPDTPPCDSPLMFESGSSGETSLIFAEAAQEDQDEKISFVEQERKMECDDESAEQRRNDSEMPQERIDRERALAVGVSERLLAEQEKSDCKRTSVVEQERTMVGDGERMLAGEERKAESDGASSSHSWHTAPNVSPTHAAKEDVDGRLSPQDGNKALPQSQSSTADTIILGEEDADNQNLSQESNKTLSLSQARYFTKQASMGQQIKRKSSSRLSTRKSCRLSAKFPSSADSSLKCSCGEILATSGEKAELKTMLSSKKYGHFKVKDIRSSKLWSHMHGKKEVEVHIVPATELTSTAQRESTDEHYNSVWEEKLGLCYSILLCPASHCQLVSGVLVHAATSSDLAGKAILSVTSPAD